MGKIPCPRCKAPMVISVDPGDYPLGLQCKRCGAKGKLKAPPKRFVPVTKGAEEKPAEEKPKRKPVAAIPCPRCHKAVYLMSTDFPQKIMCKKCGAKGVLKAAPKSMKLLGEPKAEPEAAPAEEEAAEAEEYECPECGAGITEDMDKCPKCGTEFEGEDEEEEEAEEEAPAEEAEEAEEEAEEEEEYDYECPECGKGIGEDMTRCPHCGVEFE